MNAERRVKLFNNGGNRAIRIPKDFEFAGDEATIRKDGDRLIVEPVRHWMLDTNVLSDVVRSPQGVVAQRIAAVGQSNVSISIVVAAELRFGVENRASDRLRRQVDAVLSGIEIEPLVEPVDREYATLRAALKRRGTPIGPNDLLIAAHALARGAVLVTANRDEFSRVEGLALENWLDATV